MEKKEGMRSKKRRGAMKRKRGGASHTEEGSQNISSSKLKTIAQRCLALTRLLCNLQNPIKETLLLPCAILGDTRLTGTGSRPHS